MSEQIESDPWQQLPRVNRAITCFRVVLWLLPSGFAAFSGWTGDWLIRHHYLPDLGVGGWWVANALFVLGTGWFNAQLPSMRAMFGMESETGSSCSFSFSLS